MELQPKLTKPDAQEPLGLNIGPENIWHIRVDKSHSVHSCIIDWSRYGLSGINQINLQRILLNCWIPRYKDNEYVISESQFRMHVNLMRIALIIQDNFKDKLICELDRDDLIQIFIISLFREWNDANDLQRKLEIVAKPLSYQVIDRQISAMRIWYSLYHSGAVSDGPEFDINFKEIEKPLMHELERLDINYSKWKEGESFGAIDFVVAHLLLADAIEVINSKRTKELLAYFEVARRHSTPHLIKKFWKDSRGSIERYRHTGIKPTINGTKSQPHYFERFQIISNELINPLHDLLLKINDNSEFIFPWRNYRNLVNDYNEVMFAIYIIFLSVMGKRGPSEVLTLRGIDISAPDLERGIDATMSPSIAKTNHGIRETQGVTNFIDDAFNVLLKLGYKDKTNTELPLFSAAPSSIDKIFDTPTVLSMSHSYVLLNDYYENFCLRMENKIDFDIKDLHSNITTHQFRHSFAEFGLRRFDGNVEELIRQHFCHQYNHWWTKRYTADKLDEDYARNLERRYIKELVPRIVFDNALDTDFVGGMALYIKKKFGDISSLSVADVEARVVAISEDILQVTPHEYGWCMLHKLHRSSAQCADDVGNPKPSSTDSSKCNRCANFCASRKSHFSVQQQITISHLDFLEQGFLKSPTLIAASSAAIKNAQILFPELIELGVVE